MKKVCLLLLATASTTALLAVRPTRSEIARTHRAAAQIFPLRHAIAVHSQATENGSNNTYSSYGSDSSDDVVIPANMVQNFQIPATRLVPTHIPLRLPAPRAAVNRITTRPANMLALMHDFQIQTTRTPITQQPQRHNRQAPQQPTFLARPAVVMPIDNDNDAAIFLANRLGHN